MWTRKTARGLCSRTFRSRSSNDMQRSSRLQSTNSTFAPAVSAASGVAMNVFDGQRTVSPRTPAHSSAASAAPVQPLKATASRPFQVDHSRSNSRSQFALGPALRIQDPIPELVEPRSVAMIETDRKAREIGREVGGQHAPYPISEACGPRSKLNEF